MLLNLNSEIVTQLHEMFDPFRRMAIMFFVVFGYLEVQILTLIQAWMKIEFLHEREQSV